MAGEKTLACPSSLAGDAKRRVGEKVGALVVLCSVGLLGDGGSLLVSSAARASASSNPSLSEAGLYESERARVSGGEVGAEGQSAARGAGVAGAPSRMDARAEAARWGARTGVEGADEEEEGVAVAAGTGGAGTGVNR